VEDNPLIQARSHAERLCRMVYDFHSAERGRIPLPGCPMDTRRYLGEPVYFTSAHAATGWGETETLCRIVSISVTGDGFMDVDLGRAEGLPVRSDFYLIGTAYSTSDELQLSY
jgi:hypothetical protein